MNLRACFICFLQTNRLKFRYGLGMFWTAPATHRVAIGLTVLALFWTLPVKASQLSVAVQLPDAPSTIKARQIAKESISVGIDPGVADDDPVDSVSVTSWKLPQLAFNGGFDADYQQSLYRPSKQIPAPGFSSSIAEKHPVPGAAPVLQNPCPDNSCSLAQSTMCCGIAPSPFARYLKTPGVVPLTARDNLRSAVKNIIDPFNLLTIGADAAIGIASDPDSPYGPGMRGFFKYAGVSLTEDMTGEFFGTFLIPSIMHQDPHYHRQPFVSVKRRILHAVTQVVWAQSYTGQPMFNYGNVLGSIATAAVSNTFVPGPNRQGFDNTAQRLAIAFAISPSGNLIEEFLPDIASRINLKVVIFQRILNTVSLEESGVP
jgi:hypothetical protein